MYRSQVYEAIDQERSHQDREHPGHKHETAAYLVYMQHYMQLAMSALATGRSAGDGLTEVRKIAALAVACLEQHGCPPR